MSSSVLLDNNIRPIEKYFKTPGLVEICINQPGEIWLETFDGWKCVKDKDLTLAKLKRFAAALATNKGQKFSDEIPFLATSLPKYGYRVFVTAGTVAVGGFSMTIRIAAASRFEVEQYISGQGAETLKEAILLGKTILVAGGTSSGKTTLLNSLIYYIPPEVRIISIEDSPELQIDNENKVSLIKSKTGTDVAKVSYEQIINACMRMRPDRLILGELDTENTELFLRIINTGHGGSMATVHADSPERAIHAIVMNIQMAGSKADEKSIIKYALEGIDIIVHIKRVSRKEFVAELKYTKDMKL